jgi:flavin-dependent dehydrogenase
MYDIAIIGAGPAGATIARLLGEKYKIFIIDKRRCEAGESAFENGKCCGGLLAPDAQKVLAKLGLVVPQNIFVGPQLFAVRALDMECGLEKMYQRFYLNIDRQGFDNWLSSLIPGKVDKQLGASLKKINSIDAGYEVVYSINGERYSIQAKIVVGADGAKSMVRSLMLNTRKTPKKYIAMQEWYEADAPGPYYSAIFDREITDFYSWIILKGDHVILGSALRPKENIHEKFDLLKARLEGRGFNFGERIKTEGAFINRPINTGDLCFGEGNIILAGEAAGAISPSSAEGISYAMRTGLIAAQSLSDGLEGAAERYHKKVWTLKLNLLGKNLKSPVMYNPILRRPVMKLGLQSIR